MVTLLIYGWVLAILLLMFTNERLGIALFIPYVILMPFFNPTILYVLVLVAYVLAKRRTGEDFSWDVGPTRPFFLFFVAFLCLIPFQSFTPIGAQIGYWCNEICTTMILPLLIWWEVQSDKTSYYLFRKVLIACILIVSIYGLLLTLSPGSNPYLFFLMDSIGIDAAQDLKTYTEAGDGRMFGRISSFFLHPMTFGLFLGMSLVYWISISHSQRDKYFYLTIVLLSLNAVFCGVRSVIAALFIVGVIYVVFERKIPVSKRTLVLFLVALVILSQIPYLQTYIGSIFGGSNDEVSGSSLDMRLMQYLGCLDEFMDSPWIGKGYAWHKYYVSTYGDHPILLAFESLVYVVLCDGGLMGVLIWCMFMIGYMIAVKRGVKHDFTLFLMLIAFYISYSCITGEFGYMKYFLLFFILLYIDRQSICHVDENVAESVAEEV